LTLTESGAATNRIPQAAYYGLPMLFCVIAHWLALKTWFYNDDFAWLAQRLLVHSPGDLLHVLFSPQAEGTVRTLSERLFFLVFGSVFPLQAWPFRAWVFLTQCANIFLLIQIGQRVTGSARAAFLAALLWSANAALAEALCWTSAYNEIAAAFFILLAFRLFLAYMDTGRRSLWIWQWVVFLLGFGALEINVIYPLLASCYALCCARKYLRQTLYLFIPSVFFIVLHLTFIHPQGAQYQMYFDSALPRTLWSYWSFATGALRDSQIDWRPVWLGLATTLCVTLALAVFLYREARAKRWQAVFLAAWFFIALSPVLPLKNHFTEYYLTVPAIGLAILAGWAIASARHTAVIAAAATLACLYATVSLTDTHITIKYRYNNARRMKYLVQGLDAQQKLHPHVTAVLSGIDNDLFFAGFCDNPFHLVGIEQIYLAPGSEQAIQSHPEWNCDPARFAISADDTTLLLHKNRAEVFTLDGKRVRDITKPYLATAWTEFLGSHSDFVDVADPAYQDRLGPTWYPVEGEHRWMPKTATVRFHGPTRAGQSLEAAGFCPAALLAHGPISVTFRADEVTIGYATLSLPDQPFRLWLPFPDQLVGRGMMNLEIEVSRVLQAPGDPRPLGLVFTTFTIK
jgi:hypothetical protein